MGSLGRMHSFNTCVELWATERQRDRNGMPYSVFTPPCNSLSYYINYRFLTQPRLEKCWMQ
jgi:hypothetical protein